MPRLIRAGSTVTLEVRIQDLLVVPNAFDPHALAAELIAPDGSLTALTFVATSTVGLWSSTFLIPVFSISGVYQLILLTEQDSVTQLTLPVEVFQITHADGQSPYFDVYPVNDSSGVTWYLYAEMLLGIAHLTTSSTVPTLPYLETHRYPTLNPGVPTALILHDSAGVPVYLAVSLIGAIVLTTSILPTTTYTVGAIRAQDSALYSMTPTVIIAPSLVSITLVFVSDTIPI